MRERGSKDPQWKQSEQTDRQTDVSADIIDVAAVLTIIRGFLLWQKKRGVPAIELQVISLYQGNHKLMMMMVMLTRGCVGQKMCLLLQQCPKLSLNGVVDLESQ